MTPTIVNLFGFWFLEIPSPTGWRSRLACTPKVCFSRL